jgi:hypothetical protein
MHIRVESLLADEWAAVRRKMVASKEDHPREWVHRRVLRETFDAAEGRGVAIWPDGVVGALPTQNCWGIRPHVDRCADN